MVALTTGLIDPSLLLIAWCIASACSVYNSICEPDLVAYSSLITGYSKCGNHKELLHLFAELRMSGKKPDCVLVAIVLGSCAELWNSVYGKEVHGYVIRLGLELDIKIRILLCGMLRFLDVDAVDFGMFFQFVVMSVHWPFLHRRFVLYEPVRLMTLDPKNMY
ncbi:unnamed protein product [Arabidopsis arenosa]|uniref:Pentatricopeptide repeat-containing protein n=1 Tax=Arabidopsis arenosa TaxID=38785 RepID=A0A8S2ABP1_ARAAE|nr:unnamed protein product [Arabidopsis arenosa]